MARERKTKEIYKVYMNVKRILGLELGHYLLRKNETCRASFLIPNCTSLGLEPETLEFRVALHTAELPVDHFFLQVVDYVI